MLVLDQFGEPDTVVFVVICFIMSSWNRSESTANYVTGKHPGEGPVDSRRLQWTKPLEKTKTKTCGGSNHCHVPAAAFLRAGPHHETYVFFEDSAMQGNGRSLQTRIKTKEHQLADESIHAAAGPNFRIQDFCQSTQAKSSIGTCQQA